MGTNLSTGFLIKIIIFAVGLTPRILRGAVIFVQDSKLHGDLQITLGSASTEAQENIYLTFPFFILIKMTLPSDQYGGIPR